METFLESCNLLRLNHEEIENLDRLINIKEIETVVENLPESQMASLVNSTKYLEKS